MAKIEAEAFHDGYHLALAFSNGSCKMPFCPNTECFALVPGQGCPHRLKARSPMEGVGMDAYTMATSVGWDIYPIGVATLPSEVPYGMRLGLVLICWENESRILRSHQVTFCKKVTVTTRWYTLAECQDLYGILFMKEKAEWASQNRGTAWRRCLSFVF